MNSHFQFAATLLTICLLGHDASADDSAFVRVEAETAPQGKVLDDAEASGGKFVQRAEPYQPVLVATVPPGLGDSLGVWLRRRGESVQLKAIDPDGKQRELKWDYGQPKEWVWTFFGRFPRATLGERITVIRGASKTAMADVDVVVFSSDEPFNPDTALPPPPPIAVTVDWAKVTGRATRRHFGLNGYAAVDPKGALDPAYQANMEFMAPGLVRLHHGALMHDSQNEGVGWLDHAQRQWDAAKIGRVLAAVTPRDATLMICIPEFPAWMDADHDGRLDAGQGEAFAQLCADLVKLVNHGPGRRVEYWEVTNELDGAYYKNFHRDGGTGPLLDPAKPDRLDELIAIFNQCAAAMKRADPAIKVGGPAVANSYLIDFHRRFIEGAQQQLDFYSYHLYVSGSAGESDAAIMAKGTAAAGPTREIVKRLRAARPARPIEAILDEFNISWTWKVRDPRMTGSKGAVFDALTAVSAITAGADTATAWNDRDGIYGKTGGKNERRPGADWLHLANEFLIGEICATTTSAEKAVVPFAVRTARGQSLLLINRDSRRREVRLTLGENGEGSWQRHEISATGTTVREEAPGHTVTLPEHSLTLWTR